MGPPIMSHSTIATILVKHTQNILFTTRIVAIALKTEVGKATFRTDAVIANNGDTSGTRGSQRTRWHGSRGFGNADSKRRA